MGVCVRANYHHAQNSSHISIGSEREGAEQAEISSHIKKSGAKERQFPSFHKVALKSLRALHLDSSSERDRSLCRLATSVYNISSDNGFENEEPVNRTWGRLALITLSKQAKS